MLILHLSDPHFGTEQAPVVEALAALTLQQGPDIVVVSGDITQRARRRQAVGRALAAGDIGVGARRRGVARVCHALTVVGGARREEHPRAAGSRADGAGRRGAGMARRGDPL